MSSYKRKLPATRKNERGFVKLTSKQLAVYYWLISKAYYNSRAKEDHYYIYKDDIVYSKIAKELGIGSVNTVKTAIKKLDEVNYIYIDEKGTILIPHKSYFTYLNIRLINFLLAWSSILDAELLLYYSILKRYFELNEERGSKARFNTKLMVELLGHNPNDKITYKKYRLYLAFLENYNLIKIEKEIKHKQGGEYVEYILLDINETVSVECGYDEKEEKVEVDEKVLDTLSVDMDIQIEEN